MNLPVKRIWLGLMATLFLATCNLPQEEAIGGGDVIMVLSEDENWEIAEPILTGSLGRIVRTPQNESLYEFVRITPDQLEANLKIKNLVILTRLEVHSEISGQVRSMLPDSTLNRIRESQTGIYLRANAYAAGQALMIVAAKNPPDLRNRLRENQDAIFNFFENKFLEREEAFVYRSGEQREMAEGYYEKYGWYLRMMHTFVEIVDNPAQQFVWWGRDLPIRWLTISWMDPVDTLDLQASAHVLLERTYGTLLSDVQLNRDYLLEEEVWFKEYSAYRLSGLWESKEEVKGGPFAGYVFYEPEKDRIYFLNGLVFAPDRRKVPYIRQLETIMHSFATQPYEE